MNANFNECKIWCIKPLAISGDNKIRDVEFAEHLLVAVHPEILETTEKRFVVDGDE